MRSMHAELSARVLILKRRSLEPKYYPSNSFKAKMRIKKKRKKSDYEKIPNFNSIS